MSDEATALLWRISALPWRGRRDRPESQYDRGYNDAIQLVRELIEASEGHQRATSETP